MPVIITAHQAVPGDVVRDQHGTLWVRQHHAGFALTYFAKADLAPADYGIEPDDELEIPADRLDSFGPLTIVVRNGQPVTDALPKPAMPRTVSFTWYLYGGKPYEEREAWNRALGFDLDDALREKIGNPFCEVELSCVLDTETGVVEILSVK